MTPDLFLTIGATLITIIVGLVINVAIRVYWR